MRPHVVLSTAMSVDGYLDDTTDRRLLLSNDEDIDRVDELRASVDAIMVGANTVRRDNPRLLLRSVDRQQQRIAAGRPPHPLKVTVTASGNLDRDALFFAGDTGKIVYTNMLVQYADRARIAPLPVDLGALLADLAARGIGRLLVEGGSATLTQLLTAGLADELHLVVAPLFVGDARAPRLVGNGQFPHDAARRMTLAEVRPIGDVVLLHYLLGR